MDAPAGLALKCAYLENRNAIALGNGFIELINLDKTSLVNYKL